MKCDENMPKVHHAVWSPPPPPHQKKRANIKIYSAPKLKTLPPTTEAFHQHIYCAHMQTMIWKSKSSAPPAAVDPVLFGWTRKEEQKLFPVMLPESGPPAPTEVMKIIKCGCASASPCSIGRCGCVLAQMSCSMFCLCLTEKECNNAQTRFIYANNNEEFDV